MQEETITKLAEDIYEDNVDLSLRYCDCITISKKLNERGWEAYKRGISEEEKKTYRCKNNPNHLLAFDIAVGWYCLECECGKDKNLIKVEPDDGEEI